MGWNHVQFCWDKDGDRGGEAMSIIDIGLDYVYLYLRMSAFFTPSTFINTSM